MTSTVCGMPKRHRTPLLKPRDYAGPPDAFGTPRLQAWQIPPDGDAFSRNLARVQHRLVVIIRTTPDPYLRRSARPRKDSSDRGAASRLVQRWSFSRSYWQLCVTGRSWMSVAAMAAAIEYILDSTETRHGDSDPEHH